MLWVKEGGMLQVRSGDCCICWNLWCSFKAQLVQLSHDSGHSVVLLSGMLGADSENWWVTIPPGYCERTAKMRLLGQGGEGVLLQCQHCSSWACLDKENRWLCAHRVSLGETKIQWEPLYGCWKKCFSAPCEDIIPSPGLRKLLPAIATSVMHLLLPLSITEHFGLLEQRLHFVSDWWKCELFIRGTNSWDFILSCMSQ